MSATVNPAPPANGRFKSLVWGLMVGILVLGLLRMLWVSEEDGVASTEESSVWAQCLPSVAIPANSNITLVSLEGDARAHKLLGSSTDPRIEYVSTQGVSADPISQGLNAALSGTGQATIPQNEELKVNKGEFWLTGNIEARLDSGERLIIHEPGRLRMAPAEGFSYVIKLAEKVALDPSQANVEKTLPAGVKGRLTLADKKSVTFKTLEATSGKPFLYNMTAKIVPFRAFGEKGPAAVSIEVAGVNLNSGDLAACAITANQRHPASVTEVSSNQGGVTNLTVRLPTAVLPELGWPERIHIAVASLDGKFVAHGALEVYPRLWGAIIATILTVALFGAILKTRYVTTSRFVSSDKTDWSRWFAGLFITDGDKDPSLSLFQVFFWTIITVWGLFYTFAVTGSLLHMTPQMLTLLGIAGTGSVIARWIGLSRGETSEPTTSAGPTNITEPFRFWDILNTRGHFDLMKLQLLVYTLLLGVYVVCRIAESGAFPALDPNTLLLLGISQGVYIGGKLGGTTPLAKAQALKLDFDLNSELTTKLPDEIKSAETARDDEKARREAWVKEKADVELEGKNPVKVDELKKKIAEFEAAIKQWETTIAERKKALQEATNKAGELKASLEKVIKEELKLQST